MAYAIFDAHYQSHKVNDSVRLAFNLKPQIWRYLSTTVAFYYVSATPKICIKEIISLGTKHG